MSIVGNRIRHCRESQGLSITKLAEKSGLTISAISQFESGTRDPSLDSLNKLADSLQISVDYLLGRDEYHSDKNLKAMFRGLQDINDKDRETMLDFFQYLKAKEHYKKKAKDTDTK